MNVGNIVRSALKTTKGKIISIGGGTAVAVGIGAAVLLQGEGFRSISVEQVTGTVSIVGEKNNGQAYVGEHLYSGDDVTVGDASELTMCMDNDKYVYADANTHFMLEASAAKDDSLIKIYLDAGSELNELQSKLDPNDTYEVDTPNSTMSVRGTEFRVTVYKAKDGLIYTLTEVKDGEVLVRLKTTDGTYNGIERLFTPGQSTLIRGNSDFSEFVTSDMLDNADLSDLTDEDTVLMLAYDSLPEDGLERLIALLENGGLIEEDEETDEEIKTQVALRPSPMPTLSPTPSPTPSPRPTGPSQEELLRQLLELMQTTPSPTPVYTPTEDEEAEDSSDDSEPEATPEPSPTGQTTIGYSYDPATGAVEYYGTYVGQVVGGEFRYSVDGGTITLPLMLNGTSYSIANNNVDISNSGQGITYDEAGLDIATAISTVQSYTKEVNVQTSRGGIVGNTNNGVRTYESTARDIDAFNTFQTAGEGKHTLLNNGTTNSGIVWVESTVDSNGDITQYRVADGNGFPIYTVTGTQPTYDSSNHTITGTVIDSQNTTHNFTIDENGDFII